MTRSALALKKNSRRILPWQNCRIKHAAGLLLLLLALGSALHPVSSFRLLGNNFRYKHLQQQQQQQQQQYQYQYDSTCLSTSAIISTSRPITNLLALKGGGENDNTHPMNNDDDALLDEILKVAITASQKAAAIIAEYAQGANVVETKSTSRDLLTLVDPLCEQAIRETVLERFPDHGFLGEEGVEPGIEAAKAALEEKLQHGGWLWICDPIDGTTNFASGIPLSAPSVAVAYNGEIMVGVIHDPHRNEVWTAVRGRGAFLNGNPIHVPSATSTSTSTSAASISGNGIVERLADAVIGAESPAGQQSLEHALQGIQVLMPLCRTIRILGSTAVQMPWVVMGRLTCYWSPDECAWDHAAGAIIVQEAGGVITDLDGTPFTLRTRRFLVSQNDKIHQQVLDVLQNQAGIL